jgi:hypothetical protein
VSVIVDTDLLVADDERHIVSREAALANHWGPRHGQAACLVERSLEISKNLATGGHRCTPSSSAPATPLADRSGTVSRAGNVGAKSSNQRKSACSEGAFRLRRWPP